MTTKPATTILILTAASEADDIGGYIENHHGTVRVLSNPDDSSQVIDYLEKYSCDIVILDIAMANLSWTSTVYEIKQRFHTLAVIVLAAKTKSEDLLSAFREGADAYLTKESPAELAPALRAVRQGQSYYSYGHMEVIRKHMLRLELGSDDHVAGIKDGIKKLSVREKEVFPLLANGKSIKETGQVLGISPKTVETHKYHIMEKLNLENMAEVTKLAVIKDLIPIDRP